MSARFKVVSIHHPDSPVVYLPIPNWSQLRSTPMSFRPSRRAIMSFSGGTGKKEAGFALARLIKTKASVKAMPEDATRQLTVGQVEELGGGGEHLRRKLGYHWRQVRAARRRRGRVIDAEVLHGRGGCAWSGSVVKASP